MTTRLASRCSLLLLSAGLLLALPADAQSRGGSRGRGGGARQPQPAATNNANRDSSPFVQGNAGSDYGDDQADAPRRRRAKKPARVVFPAGTPMADYPSFRMLEGGASRVSIEINKKVDVIAGKLPGHVSYKLRGTHVAGWVQHMPLPTGFFSSPVGRIDLVEHDDGAELVIELRESTAPAYRVIDTPRGAVLQIDFPPAVSPDIHTTTVAWIEQSEQDGSDSGHATRGTDTKRLKADHVVDQNGMSP